MAELDHYQKNGLLMAALVAMIAVVGLFMVNNSPTGAVGYQDNTEYFMETGGQIAYMCQQALGAAQRAGNRIYAGHYDDCYFFGLARVTRNDPALRQFFYGKPDITGCNDFCAQFDDDRCNHLCEMGLRGQR